MIFTHFKLHCNLTDHKVLQPVSGGEGPFGAPVARATVGLVGPAARGPAIPGVRRPDHLTGVEVPIPAGGGQGEWSRFFRQAVCSTGRTLFVTTVSLISF